ncbi:hypothetical protein BS47DRAFT_1369154 [Hydnum rufescens UP504]|uniref:Uncharacterized protein n=1 Tax=Hydnum rufescens UP504 TaxID=1448309 RepID=A0A9P6AEY8_9AGAM|nr:hypothetical protein BS47DRAFT_1369154 [Hydnum rufescens UP504]
MSGSLLGRLSTLEPSHPTIIFQIPILLDQNSLIFHPMRLTLLHQYLTHPALCWKRLEGSLILARSLIMPKSVHHLHPGILVACPGDFLNVWDADALNDILLALTNEGADHRDDSEYIDCTLNHVFQAVSISCFVEEMRQGPCGTLGIIKGLAFFADKGWWTSPIVHFTNSNIWQTSAWLCPSGDQPIHSMVSHTELTDAYIKEKESFHGDSQALKNWLDELHTVAQSSRVENDVKLTSGTKVAKFMSQQKKHFKGKMGHMSNFDIHTIMILVCRCPNAHAAHAQNAIIHSSPKIESLIEGGFNLQKSLDELFVKVLHQQLDPNIIGWPLESECPAPHP